MSETQPRTNLEPVVEQKVFGEYETANVPIGQLVRMPQVRKGKNSELEALKDSIRVRGRLLNAIDVARMGEPELEKYMEFVNRTWKTDVSIDNYRHQQQPDGTFYLVIAGHSRTLALSELNEENPGYEYAVVAKVHDVTEYEDIIAIQLDENIYSPPQPARRAQAIVESYHHGLDTGKWKDEYEFREKSEAKFSPSVLKDAIGFSKLPLEAQDFVFAGKLSYSAGVALGNATDTLREYVTRKREGYRSEDRDAIAFDDQYNMEVALLIAHICGERMGAARAKAYVEAQVGHKQTTIEEMDGLRDRPTLFLISAEEQVRAYQKKLKLELQAARLKMNRTSVESVRDVQRLLGYLVGEGDVPDDLEKERAYRSQALGVSATRQLVEMTG